MRKLIFVAVVVAGLLGIGAFAYASIPGPDGVIHGCRKTSNPAVGAVIVVDSEATCPSGYEPLNWNQTGPQAAPPQVVQATVEVVVGGSNPDLAIEVYCPSWQSGERALGGGGAIPGDQDPNVQWVLTASDVIEENATHNPVGWRVQAHRFGGTSTNVGSLVAHVVCASS